MEAKLAADGMLPLLVSVLVIGLGALVAGVCRHPQLVVRHPKWVLGSLLLASCAAGFSLLDLPGRTLEIDLDASEEPLMLRADPARDFYERATQRFGTDDQVLLAMETETVFSPRALDLLRTVSDACLHLPHVRRVDSLINAQDYDYDSEFGGIAVRDFVEKTPDDPERMEALAKKALADLIYPRLWVSPDRRMAAIAISFQAVSDQDLIDSGFHSGLREIIEAASSDDIRWYVTGRPHVKGRAYELMVRDLLRLIPLSMLVAFTTLVIVTGSWGSALIPLTASLMATLWTFGLMASLGRSLNLISLVLGPTLISLGGLYAVHVIGRYRIEAREEGSPVEVALRTLTYVRLPVALAGGSTCAGFAALTLAEVPATTELGLFAVFGIASLTLISLAGCGAALATWPLAPIAADDRFDALLSGCARFVLSHRNGVLWCFAGLVVLALALLPRVVIDTDYLTFFDQRSSVRKDYAAIGRGLVGPTPLYLTFEGVDEGTFREPKNLRQLAEIQKRLEALPSVSAAFSMVSPVRKLNRALEEGRDAELRIPDSREEVSDVVFMIPKDELRRFATSNHRAANIMVRTDHQGSKALRRLEREVAGVVGGVEMPGEIEVTLTGNALVLNRSADRIASDQLRSVGTAAVVILLMVWWLFGSVKTAILAMLPNLVPVLLFFGLLASGVAPLSIPTGLIGALTLGVAVDDTVHFLIGYLRKRDAGLDPDGAVRETLRNVGRPIIVTSLMLVAGFLTVLLSEFATIREFGALTATVMGLCLVADLVLFPALLARRGV